MSDYVSSLLDYYLLLEERQGINAANQAQFRHLQFYVQHHS